MEKFQNNITTLNENHNKEIELEIKPNLRINNMVIKKNINRNASLINRWESFYKILRVTSYCLKALALFSEGITNSDKKKQIQEKAFSVAFLEKMENPNIIYPQHLEAAKLYHIPESQYTTFDEYDKLNKGLGLNENSKLAQLNPSITTDGVMRMQSRLDHHEFYPEQIRTPVILPKETKITEKIVLDTHKRFSHAGPEICLLVREIKLKYWITGGRREIRRCLKNCMNKNCRFPHLTVTKQLEANLPIGRRINEVFEYVSLDYCGNFFIKTDWRKQSIKSKITTKIWVLVIICHATRAIHLEMVYDHTTDQFLLALKRFVNRRSTPKVIMSDCEKEFIKGKSTVISTFDKLNNSTTHQRLSEELKIKWYHSTSRSPSHNGVCEAAVKIIKKQLYNALNGQLLNANEFYTLLTDVESCVNSRPLGAISESPDDGNIITITPNHLLHGKPLKPLPTEMYKGIEGLKRDKSLKEKWHTRQKIIENFWTAWKKEFLTDLRKYHNSIGEKENIKLNACVLILTEKITKRDWPIGAVNKLLYGRDGLVRSVEVRMPLKASDINPDGSYKTQYKLLTRGIEQIILL